MSRSGYIDDGDCDDVLAMGRWQGQVASAIRGKRGQAALRELAAAMDAMPVKALAAESLVTADGEFCTLGVLGQARGIDMAPIDPEDWDAVAKAFNLAPAMVREIVYRTTRASAPTTGSMSRSAGRFGPTTRNGAATTSASALT